jgi:CDP-glucose 4,6-dehydratase
MGATVAGYSRGGGANDVAPVVSVASYRGDITDQARFGAAVNEFQPEIIIHLAGSTTVAAGFRSPLDTFAVNVTGTSAVLHAALRQPTTKAVVVAGTPAVVNLDDSLEVNPYPASKLAVEAVVGAFAHPRTQQSAGRTDPLAVGVARPGVMVGGDWAEGRLLADVVRDVRAGRPVVLRAPAAVRPWQHVLEGVGGVLLLGSRLFSGTAPLRRYDFGRTAPERTESVGDVVKGFLAELGVPDWPVRLEGEGGDRVELGAGAALADLGWAPVWDLDQALRASARWYQAGGAEEVGAVMGDLGHYFQHPAATGWNAGPCAVVARRFPWWPAPLEGAGHQRVQAVVGSRSRIRSVELRRPSDRRAWILRSRW